MKFTDLDKVENPISSISDKYPTYLSKTEKSTKNWLDGKRTDDNAENLWRVHDKIYDLSKFIKLHPGGTDWLEWTKGCDITEQFETHHIDTKKVEQILAKYYVRDAKLPRNYKFTFADDGFYRTLKRKVAEKMNQVDKEPIKMSKVICDVILGLVFVTSILAMKDRNIYLAILSGIFVHWSTVIAHNFFHQKDNWRMMTFNLSLLNYRDWRVSHAMSHHIYTNSYYDMEISMFEPFLQWLPRPKSFLNKLVTFILSPIVWILLTFFSASFKFMGYFTKQEQFKLDHLIPLALPMAMYIFGVNDTNLVLKYWLFIIAVSSFLMGLVGLNAGHHHPDVTHEGDEIDSTKDFGIFQMNCVIDRRDTKQSLFWTLTTFGQHTLHHMFPTLDHAILPQLEETFLETCKEFNLQLREFVWWPLIVGQFQQLQRTKVKSLDQMNTSIIKKTL